MALISNQLIRKIETELYNYPLNLKELNEQRDDIMNGSHYPDVSNHTSGNNEHCFICRE